MNERLFKNAYKLLAVIGIGSVIIPIISIFFAPLIRTSWFIVYLFSALLIMFGYGLQAIYGAMTAKRHNQRADYNDESGYESADNLFKPLAAALPITIAAVLSFLSYGIFDKVLLNAYMAGEILKYDSDSLYPFIGVISMFVLIFAGIFLWFFPSHRLISLRTLLPFFGVLCVSYVMMIMMSVDTNILTFSLIIFTACAFLVLNQTYIQRSVSNTLTAISPAARFYNMKLVAVAVVGVIFTLFIFAVLFTGVGFVLKFIFTFLIVKIVGISDADSEYMDVSDAEVDFSEALLRNQSSGDKFLIVLCFIFFIAAIIMAITRGTAATKRFIDSIRTWLRELFMFFTNMGSFKLRNKAAEVSYANFVDEEINLQDADIKPYESSSGKTRSYRDFINRLNGLPSAAEQIRYAYVTMLYVFKSLQYGVKSSETPRETRDRVAARMTENNIAKITEAIETVDYIETEPSEEQSERAVHDMCKIIQKHFTA